MTKSPINATRRGLLAAGLSGLAVAPAVLGAGGVLAADAGPLRLLNVSYDPTRELYKAINGAYANYWKSRTGQDLIITLNGISALGDKPVYYQYGPIKYSFNFRVVWGTYNFTVQIGTKKTITGRFRIYNYDKTTMNVYPSRVVIAGP